MTVRVPQVASETVGVMQMAGSCSAAARVSAQWTPNWPDGGSPCAQRWATVAGHDDGPSVAASFWVPGAGELEQPATAAVAMTLAAMATARLILLKGMSGRSSKARTTPSTAPTRRRTAETETSAPGLPWKFEPRGHGGGEPIRK